MTTTKIRLRSFKNICEEARNNYESDIANGFDITYREALEDALECAGDFWKTSDEWNALQVAAPASFDEIYSHLRVAASRRQQFGATDAQCAAIARQMVAEKATTAQLTFTTLTRGEASNILG